MGRTTYKEPTGAATKATRKYRRGPAQYAVLALNSVACLTCFLGAGGLVFGQHILGSVERTAAIIDPGAGAASTTPDGVVIGPTIIGPDGAPEVATTTTQPFPTADLSAKNFLVTGADNGACSADGQFSTGDRSGLGQERSDSIMVIRIDPPTGRAAVLSFPRDLWVKIDGSNAKQRINTAYRAGNPQKLINTIYNNFGVRVDHSIEIDLCAFKTLVDSVGGVAVPIEYPIRDQKSVGLLITETGCHNFNGDEALAYVRSRHFQRQNPSTGKWETDPSSDFGRISRQQDFLRRAITKLLSKGPFNIDVASGLIDIATQKVKLDPDLTAGKMLEFAGVLKGLDPTKVQTYQIEGSGKMISGNSVLEPRIGGKNMQAILAIFRGQAQLAGAPEQLFGPPPSDAPTTTVADPTTAPVFVIPTTTLPTIDVTENVKGFVPPKDVICP